MNIKKIFAGLATPIIIVACMVSCQDRLEEEYLNPEATTNATVDKFFTKMLDNRRVRADYWNIRTFLVMHPGVYTNIVSYTNSPKRFQQQLSYLNDFWKDYYTPNGDGVAGIVPHMREIQRLYNGMTDAEKANAEVFLQAAQVLYFDQTSQLVDIWGDIPYSEAGSLNLSGGSATLAKFDDAEEIYTNLIDGLETAASYFRTATLDPLVAASFGKQDMLLKGNLDKWERYANSIKLRLLMRISNQNEGKAETEIMEMLNDPATYPLVDQASFNVLLDPLTNYTDFMRNAVTELSSHLAPEFLLDGVLKPSSDPRIRVLFDKGVSTRTGTAVPNADYFAMPEDANATVQEDGIAKGDYAVLDSTTFMFNTKFPGIVITSAEVHFLKAEAFERWGTTGEAQTSYEQGVTDAINFVFYLNQVGATFRGVPAEDAVTPTEITDALASPTVAYSGTQQEKLQKIWLQKWVSFGFMQSIQSWSEYRRTDYPTLSFVPDASTPDSELPPVRLFYPADEKTFNAANYEAVKADDTPDTKIFWDIN